MKKVKIYGVFVILFLAFLFYAQSLFAGTAPSLELLAPKRGEEIPYGSELALAISIYDPEGDTDTSTIEFKVDGKNVTPNANVSTFLVTYLFENTTMPGKHTISFVLKDREGNKSELESFFNVSPRPEREKKYSLNGSVQIGGELESYDTTGGGNSQNVVATSNLNLYGTALNAVDYSILVEYTNEESTDNQRVSTYRLGLNSPIGGFVLGDATPSFSSYTINGTEVFGVHLLPQFGPIGLELLYGQGQKAVDDPPTFNRMFYGGRLKVGRERSFLWGLSLLKVKDDKGSLDTTEADPKDNIVLGTDVSLSIFNGVVTLKGEANESLLNENIRGGAGFPADIGENLPIDPKDWEWLITLNEYIVPIPTSLDALMSSLAAKASLKVGPILNNTLNFEYRYIGAGFYSLGNTAITNDQAGIKAWDSLWLFNKRFFLSLAYQNYKNNLQKTLDNTTKTQGYSGNLYLYPTDYLSFNGGVDILSVSDRANVDSVNTKINGGVSRRMEVLKTSSSAFFNGIATLLKDEITPSSDTNDFSSRLGLNSFFNQLPLDSRIVIGYDFGDSPDSLYIEGGIGYRFLKDESLYANLSTIYQTGSEELEVQLGASFDTIFETTLDGSFEYLSSPGSKDIALSVFATREF